MMKLILFCNIILCFSTDFSFGLPKLNLLAGNIKELNEVADLLGTVSLNNYDEILRRVEPHYVSKASRVASIASTKNASVIVDLFTPPEDVSIEKFSMAKVVLFNEFAKTIGVSLDDILFAAKSFRKQMLVVKDVLEKKNEFEDDPKAEILFREMLKKENETDFGVIINLFKDPKDVTLENIPVIYVAFIRNFAKNNNITVDDTMGFLKFAVLLKEAKPPKDPLKLLKALQDSVCPASSESNAIQNQPLESSNTTSEIQRFIVKFVLGEHWIPLLFTAIKNTCGTPVDEIAKSLRVSVLLLTSMIY